jgi:hypothetical protein
MKFTFTEASGLRPTVPVACAPGGDPTVYNSLACSATFATDPYVIVTGLRSGQFSYQVEITSIVNPPSSAFVSDILCEFCSDDACSSIEEPGAYTRATYTPDVLFESDVTIASTGTLNGEEDSTLEVGILLANALVAGGTITMDMPK